jgi:hypothetical protein
MWKAGFDHTDTIKGNIDFFLNSCFSNSALQYNISIEK